MRQSVTFVDGNCARHIQNPARLPSSVPKRTRTRQDRHVRGVVHAERLKHHLRHALSVGLQTERSFGDQNRTYLWCNLLFIKEKCDAKTVVDPTRDEAVLSGDSAVSTGQNLHRQSCPSGALDVGPVLRRHESIPSCRLMRLVRAQKFIRCVCVHSRVVMRRIHACQHSMAAMSVLQHSMTSIRAILPRSISGLNFSRDELEKLSNMRETSEIAGSSR